MYRYAVMVGMWSMGCAPTTPVAPAQNESAASMAQEVLATWNGGEILREQVESDVAEQLRKLDAEYRMQRYELVHKALVNRLDRALMGQAAKDRGLAGRSELIRQEVNDRLSEPTADDVEAAWLAHKAKYPRADRETAEPRLREELRESQRQALRDSLLAELRADYTADIQQRYPEMPRVQVSVSDDDPTMGPEDAPVTIVEFGEFECFYCFKARDDIDALFEAFPGQVRLVFKDFPLTGHKRARIGARAAHCAGQQGRYWDMFNLLLENHSRLGRDALVDFSTELGLDLGTWEACLEDRSLDQGIDDDLALGRRLGVAGTPTFFINGIMVQGDQDFDVLHGLVSKEIQLASSAQAAP